MTRFETDLLAAIKDRCISRGDFTLASGIKSDYYIDLRKIEVYGPASPLIGQVLFNRVCKYAPDAIGGMEVGAIPLTVACNMVAYFNQHLYEGFWVRKAAKGHGTKQLIEGRIGDRVVIVEDVISTGSSVLTAIEAVRSIGCHVEAVIGLVDRDMGARDLFASHWVTSYENVFSLKDLE